MKHLLSAICVASALTPVAAAAQTEGGTSTFNLPSQGTHEVTLSGTGSSDQDFEDNLFSLEGSYGWYLSPYSAVGVRQSVSMKDTEEIDSQWNGSTRVFYDYHFGENRARPYVGANLGYNYGDTLEETFLAGVELGIKYYVLADTFIAGQLEYQYLFDDADEIDDRFDDGSFVYTLGLGFNF